MPTGQENLDLRVYVDYPQERQNRKGPYVFATDGTQVDAGTKNNCIIDPVTLSVFGTPIPMTNEWKTGIGASTVGSQYYRFQKSDFTFTSVGGSNDWLDFDYYADGDAYIIAGTASTARQQSPIQLIDGVSRNEALFFSYSKLQKKNTDTNSLIKLFWSDPENVQNNTQLHFKTDGSCDVFRGFQLLSGEILVSNSSTAIVGNNTRFQAELSIGQEICDQYGRLLGFISLITDDTNAILTANSLYTYLGVFTNKVTPLKVQSYSRTESNYSQGRPISTIANPNDQFNDVYIIPIRGKELLVMTSYGLNFSHSFSDLNNPNPPENINFFYAGIGDTAVPITDTNISSTPVILPKGDFSIVISQGKIAFQLAKLYFLSNWSIKSQNITFPTAPSYTPTIFNSNITSSYGSTAVTGDGTSFLTDIDEGDRLFFINPNNYEHFILGSVDTVVDDTNLFISNPANLSDTQNYYKETPLSGLITYGIGSTAVTGSGTLFNSELNKFDIIYDNNNQEIGKVNLINSDTSLYLFSGSGISGTNQTNVYKNINLYRNLFLNLQGEIFGQAYPTSNDALSLSVTGISATGSTVNQFNNQNTEFQLLIKQENQSSIASTAATDFGLAFYSSDLFYTLENEKTSNSTIDITPALESLSISRSETGEISLSLDARHQELIDLGVQKPNILSNRSIKVNLEPRQPPLLIGLISFYGTEIIYGQDTLFTEEISPGDTLYLNDGTAIGIVSYIVDDTELALLSNFVGGTLEYVEYTNIPNYEPISIFEGYLDSPDITYIQGQNYEKYSLLSFNAIDKKQRLNAAYLNVAPNFDNTSLTDIFVNTLSLAGQTNNDPNKKSFITSGSLFNYDIPINRNNSQGQYNFILNLGDSAGTFTEKVRSDFSQNYTFYNGFTWGTNIFTRNGWNFSSKFIMQDLNFVPAKAPPVILYLNEETANTYGGIPIYDSNKRTIRSLQKTYETPEANRIIITGLDKTNGSRIEFLKDDVNSQNATLPPNQRPDNWLGDVYPFVMINDKLNTFSDVQLAGQQFYDKLTPGRELISFETDLLYYFNSQDKFTSTNLPLLGNLTLNATSAVLGVSTQFLTDLSIGDSIYTNQGVLIGIVQSIADNNNLTLISPTNITGSGIFFNKTTYYLNQYQHLDIGDIFYLADLENNLTAYMIIDFNVDFIREYINPSFTQIIPRSAKYRAKKVTIPVNNPPIFVSSVPGLNDSYSFLTFYENWIVSAGYTLTFTVLAVSVVPYKTITYSLTNAPAGMTITTNGSLGEIEWTPGILDSNKVFNDIVINAFDGTDTTTRTFNVRVYPTL
jgi:hypothetical protein